MNYFEEPPIRNLDSLSASVSFHGALSRSLRDKCTSEHFCAAQHITLALFGPNLGNICQMFFAVVWKHT